MHPAAFICGSSHHNKCQKDTPTLSVVARSGSQPLEAKRDTAVEVGVGEVGPGAVIVLIEAAGVPVVRVTATSTVKGTVVVSADIIAPWLAVSVQMASPPRNPQFTSPPKDEMAGISIVSDIPWAPSTSVIVNGTSVAPAGSTPFRINVVDSGPSPTMAPESSLLGPANPITNNEEASCACAVRKPPASTMLPARAVVKSILPERGPSQRMVAQ